MRTILEQHASMAGWAPESEAPQRWRLDAVCRGMTPEQMDRIFYPFAERERKQDRSVMYDEARTYCVRCPVRDECLADSLAVRDISFGFRGGLAPWDRRQLFYAGSAQHQCPECSTSFVGRPDAVYCGPNCRRIAHNRAQRAHTSRRRLEQVVGL